MFEEINNEFYFTFRGTDPITNEDFEFDSRFLKMALKEKPTEQLSKMKSNELDYDGLDGALYMDNNTFSNTEIEMEFYIHGDMEFETRQALTMLTLINSGTISFGWEEGFFRACRLNSNIEINEVDDAEYPFDCNISFTLAPYKYSVEGQEFVYDHWGNVDLKHGSKITNFYMASMPYIYLNVYPSNKLNGSLQNFVITNLRMNKETGKWETISSQKVSLYGVTGETRRICIDCVNRFIYAIDENYGENMNYLLHMDCDFPILKPGVNMISFGTEFNSNYYGGFNIIPNWRTL